MAYYNTTHLTVEDLRRRWVKAERQDDRVYLIMIHKKEATASEVHEAYTRARGMDKTPITSIRRAMNTLLKSGMIIKTDKQRIGPLGSPEYVFKINEG